MSYPMSQIQPCAYKTDKLDHNAVKNMKYSDVELRSDDLSRQTRFHYNLEKVGPGQESYIFSNDRIFSFFAWSTASLIIIGKIVSISLFL